MRKLLPLAALLAAMPAAMSAAAQDQARIGGSAPGDAQTIQSRPGDPTTQQASIDVPDIDFTEQALDNGLRVIYAPLDNAPVVHVRVFYHVGSKDEQSDRRGFAHMFEHMMFRGSANVPSEEHMRLINSVGGNSNAFTSFDQTVYINTVPANALQMALWLEADRMASFEVEEETFVTERNVVNEEYLQRVANPPYGELFTDFFKLAMGGTHYEWTPIGDMDELAQSTTDELQAFFDKYYVPNNAVLVIAGDFDENEAKGWVEDYFGWIEKGQEINRPEMKPVGDGPREMTVKKPTLPLPRITMGYETVGYGSDDEQALNVLANIVGSGRSSRLYQALVAGSDGNPPMAAFAGGGSQTFETAGMLLLSVAPLPGQDIATVEQTALDTLRKVAEEGVTEEELQKAKTQLLLGALNGRQTADSIAGSLADAAAFTGDPAEVNNAIDDLNAVTADDVQAAAQRYLKPEKLTILRYIPGQPDEADEAATGPQSSGKYFRPTGEVLSAPEPSVKAAVYEAADGEQFVAYLAGQATQPSDGVQFPDDYPRTAPIPQDVIKADFDMGDQSGVGPVDLIVIRDARIPLVGFTLLIPGGGDALPLDKTGLASLASDLMTQGAGGMSAAEWSEALERNGISLSVGDGGDHTSVSGSFPTAEFDRAGELLYTMLSEPNLDQREFQQLQMRAMAGLRQQLSSPPGVAGREFDTVVFGDAPAGRATTPGTLANLSHEDVLNYVKENYRPSQATLIVAGDVTDEQARQLADRIGALLAEQAQAPEADYAMDDYERSILVVDNPAGGQSSVRIGGRSFLNDSDDKYAASVAGQILSGGIESRLNMALRAEKGLTYGASGRFSPGRHAGSFTVSFNTKPESTGEAIRTAFAVLERIGTEPVTAEELAEAKRRVAGSLVMSTQTVGQQARLRSSVALNDYPLDYYDTYAEKINAVTVEDVMRVMRERGNPADLSIVVVGPADVIEPQVKEFGEATVVPMPLAREGGQ